MGWKSKLGYVSTDADTLAASDLVGAVLRAGTNELTSTLISGKQALDVNIANTLAIDTDIDGIYHAVNNPDPDNVGLIGHSRAASPGDSDQIERITVGAASSDDVVAANIHGLDSISFGMLFDGTTWDRARGTSGAMHIHDGGNSITVDAADLDIRDLVFATDKVDVSGSEVSLDAATLAALETITVLQGTSPWVIGDGGGSITVDGTVAVTQSTSPWVVNDAALANTAIENTAAIIDDTSGDLLAGSQLANRKYYMIQNIDNKIGFLGKSGVTPANGWKFFPGDAMELRLGAAVALHGVADTGLTVNTRVMELS